METPTCVGVLGTPGGWRLAGSPLGLCLHLQPRGSSGSQCQADLSASWCPDNQRTGCQCLTPSHSPSNNLKGETESRRAEVRGREGQHSRGGNSRNLEGGCPSPGSERTPSPELQV